MDKSRKIRIGIGAVIIMAGLISQAGWWFIGIIPLFTGIFNTCPGGSCEVPAPKVKPPVIEKEIE
ncbi:MAG: DUF2892 domain-containing protein [Ignavibacteriales bacterium]|nr:DUF2892 domain-containing protein [Ignavibacteriales bacterium]